jgi:hypothetical protein
VQSDDLARQLGDRLLRGVDQRQPFVQYSQRFAGTLGLLKQAVAEAPAQAIEPLVEADLRLLQSSCQFRLRRRQPLGYVRQPTHLCSRLTARPLAPQHCQHQRHHRAQRDQRRNGGPERP